MRRLKKKEKGIIFLHSTTYFQTSFFLHSKPECDKVMIIFPISIDVNEGTKLGEKNLNFNA